MPNAKNFRTKQAQQKHEYADIRYCNNERKSNEAQFLSTERSIDDEGKVYNIQNKAQKDRWWKRYR